MPEHIFPLQLDGNALTQVTEWLERLARRQVELGLLHPGVRVDGRAVKQILAQTRRLADRQRHFRQLLSIAEGCLTICDELSSALNNLPTKRVGILLARFGYRQSTLQAVADQLGVTRERVRQIGVQVQRTIASNLQEISAIRIQTALRLAEDMGENLSMESWSSTLVQYGLLGDLKRTNPAIFALAPDPIELLLAVCAAACEQIDYLCIPSNLLVVFEARLSSKATLSTRAANLLQELPRSVGKLLRRNQDFIGAVSLPWIASKLEVSRGVVKELLVALNYEALSDEWWISDTLPDFSKSRRRHVFVNALRKAFAICGPLSLRDVASALRHAVARHGFVAPPLDVLSILLPRYGFIQDGDRYTSDGSQHYELGRGEQAFLDCIQQHGAVVHHSELLESFLGNGLSLPLLHATIRYSPLFSKVGTGLYRLRGAQIDMGAVERARSVSEKVPVELEVQYDVSGHILVSVNLGPLAIATGVVVSDQLPNLEGVWSIMQESGPWDVHVKGNEIRRLKPALRALRCEVGDRVCLAFNAFTRSLSVEKVEMRNDP